MGKENLIRNRWVVALILGSLALLTLSTSCNKGLSTERSESVDGNGLPIVTVSALTPSTSNLADTLEVNVADGTEGFDISVRAGEKTPPLDDLFFKVVFDPKIGKADSIVLDKTNGDGSIIDLAVESEPGVIEVGIVSTNQAEDSAVIAGDALLSFRIVEGETSVKVISEVDASNLSRPKNLEFNQTEDGWQLLWDYSNPGDNNQDGEVGVADLTPIAVNYGCVVDNSWADPLRHIDGDSNGEINLADITPIATNFAAQVRAYQIEMSEDGINDFITVGQYLLNDFNQNSGETVRFTYQFGAQYVEGAWYRVVALDNEFQFGPPSEAISEAGRRVDPIQVQDGDLVTITVNVHDLEFPIQQMNSVRVKFPEGYDYVTDSTNPGSVGGSDSVVDGIWGSFCNAFLWPADFFFQPFDIGNGYQVIDFNVTTLMRTLDAAPVGYGDLFNFQLEGDGSNALTLEFVVYSDDGLLRTYYTDANLDEHEFGNKLGFEIKHNSSSGGTS